MFAEESYKTGSLSQIMADILLERGYNGRYISRTINGFVKQATVKSAIKTVGLDSTSIKNWIEVNNFTEE